ncbi:Calpain-7-like protein [Dinothrombium tinctorium]|uniref:Calpain-7-like protein n=1 Tax=Dinothrombium tinctorium TaxID=1965070 RepID=A0A3S3RVY9_9ACAR|nr:Calpain-7-like protein [Dinothrombium tinctorium]
MEQMTVEQLERSAIELANLGIHFDANKQWEPALFYYKECTSLLLTALEKGSQMPNIEQKVEQYLKRAKNIDRMLKQQKEDITPVHKNDEESDLRRAEFLLYDALDEDECGNKENAIELYSQAVELCLKAKNDVKDENIKKKLSTLAEEALNRAEKLKGIEHVVNVKNEISDAANSFGKLSINTRVMNNTNVVDNSQSKLIVIGSSNYTDEEIKVLRATSRINNREFVPFLSVDLKERFAYSLPFTDSDGFLRLSQKQSQHFARWVRLDELCPSPKIIKEIDCFSIKQTLVSDCSFIASLTVSALYEKRFKKKLVTSIIYPQNRAGEPCYNPCGKYMVKLHINGIYRKVIIDDFLPVDRYQGLLCSHSVKPDEFWVSLLEKAYLKVMGGYDFPGSNSSIDLNALTGWIPERISLESADINKIFHSLFERFHKGDVLITVATGDLSQHEADRAGLVQNHAYALLDIKNVEGHKLFLLKNPWRHLRWKGNFSEFDIVNWTPKLKAALNFDPQSARSFDNGVFWIDLKSFTKFFDTIYLNWNPMLFKYTFCTHSVWSSKTGPIKDVYNIGDNPQYSLNMDFAENHVYIALMVYKGGEKVYLPFDPPPFIDGARINSPHYLCKLVIPENGDLNYTLVLSQYEKTSTIHYTLRIYSTVSFSLNKIIEPYKYKEKVTNGEWTEKTAGGCLNNRATYHLNPVYQLEVLGSKDIENHLLIDLKAPKQYNIGFDVTTVSLNDTKSVYAFDRVSSGPYRSGFTILKLMRVPAGIYNLIPSTFNAGEKGPFFLTVSSTCPIKLKRVQ